MKNRTHQPFVLPFCLVLIIALVLACPVTAAASSAERAEPFDDLAAVPLNEMTPLFVYINRVTTSLNINAYGLATATGSIVGFAGVTDEVWIFLYLQVYNNGTWQTLQYWTTTFQGYYGYLQGSAYVASGHYYRVKGSYYAWSGNQYEQFTGYSSTVYY
jgi:hypothetical protein